MGDKTEHCGNCEADITDKDEYFCWNCNCVIDEYDTLYQEKE